jgi:hypothetical protein
MSLKCVSGRVVVKVDTEQKNGYTFEDGTEIRLERDYNNLDRKYTQQVLGVVVDGENIPANALVLFHHNSLHETYQIYNHGRLSGRDIASGIKLFSIMERDCFFWKMKDEEEWHPTEGFATALRVFEPYKGMLQGIEPTLIKDVLFVTSGELKGVVVKTVKASDYQITFRNEKGKDTEIIRFRPHGNEKDQREPEAICVMDNLTKKVNNGELLIGLTKSDAKPLEINAYAD